MDETIKSLIHKGILAPSGDNSQPWRFVISGNKLYIYILPQRDHPLLNFQQTGSYIAIGALIENIDLAAKNDGYRAYITHFPDSYDTELVASISFEKTNVEKDNLYDFLEQRHTNRRKYSGKHLDKKDIEDLIYRSNKPDFLDLIFITDENSKKIIGEAASVMDMTVLRVEHLHNAFFREIIWRGDENQTGKKGLYLKTFELPLPIEFLFRLLKSWKKTSILNKLRFSKIAGKINSKIYSSAAAQVLFVMRDYEPHKFLDVGRVMQRLWLIATEKGISAQPVTGLFFLAHRLLSGDKKEIKEEYVNEILEAYKTIQYTISRSNADIIFMLRMGYSKGPTIYSRRVEPVIEVRNR